MCFVALHELKDFEAGEEALVALEFWASRVWGLRGLNPFILISNITPHRRHQKSIPV